MVPLRAPHADEVLMSEAPTAPRAHVEMYDGQEGGRIDLRCWCVIGHDHRYADWLALPGNEEVLERAEAVWAHPLRLPSRSRVGTQVRT